MKFVVKREFESWISSNSIGRNPEYQDSSNLEFLQDKTQSRFWTYPKNIERYYSFFSCFIKRCSSEFGGWLYPRNGAWFDSANLETSYDMKMSKLLKTIGLTNKGPCAISFQDGEVDDLTKILLIMVTESRSYPDPHLIAASGKYILFFDHHHALWVKFQNETLIKPFVDALEKDDIHLPTEYPDETFKPVSWIKAKS